MKKAFTLLLATICSAAMMLSFAACNSNPDDSSVSDSSSSNSSSNVSDSSSEDSSDSSTASGKYATVADYVASDELQSQIASLKESVSAQGLDFSITGEENKLIYTYTYPEGVSTDGMADALATAIEAQASTFESVASSLKMVVDVDSPVVVVRYLASDGTEIYSTEFSAK